MAFSHGRHACPGRFFAANQLKLLLAQIVLGYDIQPIDERPQNPWLNNSIGPPMWAKLRIRRRGRLDAESGPEADAANTAVAVVDADAAAAAAADAAAACSSEKSSSPSLPSSEEGAPEMRAEGENAVGGKAQKSGKSVSFASGVLDVSRKHVAGAKRVGLEA
ncbi:hypothetical protein LTS18_000643 [Coniosporium uncinatum]|uniref:Uncharacterized protein n=1 Tax=Coniosporium uncinatum TaxID=93489 RepID=A0ACC3DFY3_9PEZI|nr:hypothetical protein LTS18_000643 [Coniosporium uncinatum]